MVVVDKISSGGYFLWLLLVVFGGFSMCVCVFFFLFFLVGSCSGRFLWLLVVIFGGFFV